MMLSELPDDHELKQDIDKLIRSDPMIWRPLPGPQLMAATSEADVIGFGGAAGGGKLLDLTTPLATPTGWTTVGEVRKGDWLFDERGVPCQVTALSAIDNSPKSFELEFDDGSKIKACADHRWLTYSAAELGSLTKQTPEFRAARRAKRPSRAKAGTRAARMAALVKHNAELAVANTQAPPTGGVRTTQQIFDTLTLRSGRANHAVPVAKPLQLLPATLPIDPYVLGAWLGDGTSANGSITGIDDGTWAEIEASGFEVRHSAKDAKQHVIIGLKVQLRALGVLRNKHVPMPYLRASREQRLSLLQGLMDTDGTVARNSGAAEFCNTNPRLAEAVQDLVTGLGWRANVRLGRAKLYGKDCGPKWTIKWVASDYVFRLERKRDLQRLATRRTTEFRYVVACRPVDPVPMRCLAVDSPNHLFLAGISKIPTHNTDLGIGLALTEHRKSFFVRHESTQLTGIIDRICEVIGTRDGYNGSDKIFRLPKKFWKGTLNRQIEFGSLPNPGDSKKYQGRPKDLLVVDEATNIPEAEVRFIMGWVRTTDYMQRCRTLMTFNPPTDAAGRWVLSYFAPWLDKNHPLPAEPGELRWFATIAGEDEEVYDGTPFVLVKRKKVYEFDRRKISPDQIIKPMSRTFIPSRIKDNPYLVGTGYMATLQALPEPLRSQMLLGDFTAGTEDSAWQVIPTAWVEAAQARWADLSPKPPMDSLGIDVARGGKDKTIMAPRHGMWFDKPHRFAGTATPDGPTVAGLAVAAARDGAVLHIELNGVGVSPYDFLVKAHQQVIGVNVAAGATGLDQHGKLKFKNLRSQLWWRMREALDPANNTGIALPNDRDLLVDLCAPEWNPRRFPEIYVESREEIIKRIGRSPDTGTAYVLALMETPKAGTQAARHTEGAARAQEMLAYDPLAYLR